MKTTTQPIKLAALNTIQKNKEPILPGSLFTVDSLEEAQRLIDHGAAVEAEVEGRVPLTISSASLQDFLERSYHYGIVTLTRNGTLCLNTNAGGNLEIVARLTFQPPNFEWLKTPRDKREKWIADTLDKLRQQLRAHAMKCGISLNFS